MKAQPMITLRGLTKTFNTSRGPVHAVAGVDLDVAEGQFLVLLGPSGSGKTTLLRCVAGLERPEAGELAIGGRSMSSAGGPFVPVEERGLGMVFQSYAIWPHMNVFDNVAFPLTQRKRRLPKAMVRERVGRALQLVKLGGLEDRPAPLLSGGQQQRVALARALAVEPKALLMDEPMSNLDARLREEVRDEIRGLVKRLGITVLYVTHDQVEAMALADCIAVMSEGKILELGSPEGLYQVPASQKVAQFLGALNQFEGTVIGDSRVQTPFGPLSCRLPWGLSAKHVWVAIRPEHVEVVADRGGTENELPASVASRVFLGETTVYRMVVGSGEIGVKTTGGRHLEVGRQIWLRLPEENLRIFEKKEERP